MPRETKIRGIAPALTLGMLCLCGTGLPAQAPGSDSAWSVYNGGKNGDHFSPLTQIDRSNVKQMRVAWTYRAGDRGGLQANPLIVGHILFAYTPSQTVVALDARTGMELWTFTPDQPGAQPSRGFSYWTDGKQGILFAGLTEKLYALDPATGHRLPGFGDGGSIDLRKSLTGGDYTRSFLALTTPGIVYKDTIILGCRMPETAPALHGDIRAFDVHTGALRWSFHTIPHPGEPGYETWPAGAWQTAGAANDWAGMALDEARGIVYAPTGSAVSDFYGAGRIGDDLFANTLLALDANTGKRLWHFQAVHHDIWDRDFPSHPALVSVNSGGKQVDAVAQTTKQGFLFLFDRVTGKPLFPIVEQPFPASQVDGETASPTQPVPLQPQPFARQRLTAAMLTTRTPEAHAWAVERFASFRSGGQFLPFAVDRQTVVFPGFDGGGEWGGPAVDPRTGVLYVNANDVPWTGGLTASQTGGGAGANAYNSQCSACHGTERKGSPPAFPSLVGVHQRLTDDAISTTIHQGRGRMPAFTGLDGPTLKALLDYLKTDPSGPAAHPAASAKQEMPSADPADEPKYRFTGYRRFLDPDGYPAVVPPWGTLNAIDLNTGQYLWKIPFGEYPELTAKGIPATGSESYGGPILTASGLLFIAATTYDHKLRAFDSKDGALLWEAVLPFAGNATPATYMVDGKQYVVIAASGLRNPAGPQGAAYVAFSLP